MDGAYSGRKPIFNLENSWKGEKIPFQAERWTGRDADIADEMV